MPKIALCRRPKTKSEISQKFRANGKLLLTGEYFVMDGALAFAFPVNKGQSMTVRESAGSELIWTSYDSSGEEWFSCKFDLLDFEVTSTTDEKTSKTLRQLLKAACRLNGDFLSKWKKYRVDTFLEFDRDWGLGSSSTLIYCLAQWADASPYFLLFNTLGGSGYDIACARAESPILYRLGEDELYINYVDFDPPFIDQLYLVYLGKKQSTEDARKHYYQHRSSTKGVIDEISAISKSVTECTSLGEFEELMKRHEEIVSTTLKLPTVQGSRFADFWGVIKSLGAWGGDFALATSDAGNEQTKSYFSSKGLTTVFALGELMLQPSPA